MEYVAFLLGINVGRRSVKMAELKALMESLNYKNVCTFLASGNVRFTAGKMTSAVLERKLEDAYVKKFGFKISVIVRTVGELEKMQKAGPFKNVKVTKNTPRYVTFLAPRHAQGKPTKPLKAGRVSYEYRILKVTPGEVFSVLELNPEMATPDVMKLLGVTYGKRITTRNWNTIEKILAL